MNNKFIRTNELGFLWFLFLLFLLFLFLLFLFLLLLVSHLGYPISLFVMRIKALEMPLFRVQRLANADRGEGEVR